MATKKGVESRGRREIAALYRRRSRARNRGTELGTADGWAIVAVLGRQRSRLRKIAAVTAGAGRRGAAEPGPIEGRGGPGSPEAQVPATEVLVTDEPVTTEWMTRSRSKTTEKPL